MRWLSCINNLQWKLDSLSHPDALVWETKRLEKGIVIVASWHIGTKAWAEWFIFFPLFEAKQRCLPTACVWAALAEYLGRAAACKTVGYEARVPIFRLRRDNVHTKGKASTAALAWGYLVEGSLGLNKVRQTFFETQIHFVTEEKNSWEVMASHKN